MAAERDTVAIATEDSWAIESKSHRSSAPRLLKYPTASSVGCMMHTYASSGEGAFRTGDISFNLILWKKWGNVVPGALPEK